MTAPDVLFRPFRIGSMELANRIVMAPMTRSMAVDGIPGAAHAAYYRRRAEGGVGLILSEGTLIDRPASRNDPGNPFFYGDAALAGWKGVIDAVHAGGARMGPQLWHTGSLKSFLTEWVPDAPVESPSGLEAPGVGSAACECVDRVGNVAIAHGDAALDARSLQSRRAFDGRVRHPLG
jgi:2,4-dienoyl-CoA reductase-like NADH-dependent reductase (Old Yellow Enzyme family)